MRLPKEYKLSFYIHIGVLSVLILFSYFRFKNRQPLPVYPIKLVNLPVSTQTSPSKVPKKAVKPVRKKTQVKKSSQKKSTRSKSKKTNKKLSKITKKKKPTIQQEEVLSLEERLKEKLAKLDTSKSSVNPPSKSPPMVPISSTHVRSTINQAFMWYITLIKQKIDTCWTEPETTFKGNYIVTVAFTVDKHGNVTNIHIIHPSELEKLNRSAINAIKLASPFPPLPKNYSYEKLDVTVDFRLEG